MNTVARYLLRSLSFALLLSVLLLLSIDVLFGLIRELNDISESYTLADVFFYVMLTIPGRIYELFPVSAVIAVVVGLGAMAAGSELIVLQASGVSRFKIAWIGLSVIAVWLLVIMLLGEFVAPKGEQMAQEFRTRQISEGKAVSSSQAVWLKDGDVVLKANQLTAMGSDNRYQLNEVVVFELENNQLRKLSKAKRASYEAQVWHLQDIQVSVFSDRGIAVEHVAKQQWQSRIVPEILNISVTRPKYLSLREIKKYQKFSHQNNVLQSSYRIAWWSKWCFPLLVFATVLCGISTLFGQIRSAGMGQRLLLGIIIGIVVYLINKALLNFGEVYHVHPFWVVMLPSVLLILAMLRLISGRKLI